MYKRLYSIGIGAYVVLCAFAVLFYKERALLPDSAFDIFHLANNSSAAFNPTRFTGGIIKGIVYLVCRPGASLERYLMCYSLFTCCYFFLCYILCGSVFKRYDAALLVLLCSILLVSDTFFYIASELPQGIAFSVVFLALAASRVGRTRPVWRLLMLITCGVLMAFFHPLMLFVVSYLLLFFICDGSGHVAHRDIYVMFVVFFTWVLVKAFFIKNPYEHHAMSGLKHFVTLFPHYFTYSDRFFLSRCISLYYWIPVLLVIITIVYVSKKEWRKLMLAIGFSLGYLFLVNVSYPDDATTRFYMENLYLPLCVFLGLPFVFDALPVLMQKKVAVPLMLLIMLTGLVRIYFAHAAYTARLDYERKCLETYGDKKVMVKASLEDHAALQMLWGTPYEFLLLSECERHKPASIIIDDNPELRLWVTGTKNTLVVNWNIIPYAQLDSRYFSFADTITAYSIIWQR